MRRTLRVAAVFAAGLVVGVIATNLLGMMARRQYREILRVDMAVEQEMLAARARRQGDLLGAVLHRWASVQSQAKDGFGAFRDDWGAHAEAEQQFSFPVYAIVLGEMQKTSDPDGRGQRALEGLDRGKYAVALEEFDQIETATAQWQLAAKLLDRKPATTRATVARILQAEDTEVHREAETVVLEGHGLTRQ